MRTITAASLFPLSDELGIECTADCYVQQVLNAAREDDI